MESDKDGSKNWKLKKVKECWFLDVGGKLKQLNVLKNAQDVQMQDDIIFADDHLFQLAEDGDDEITLIEIEDIGIKDKWSECENTDTIYMRENGESCAGIDKNNRESGVYIEKAGKEDITQETTDPALTTSDVDETWPDLEKDYFEMGSDELVLKKGKMESNKDGSKNWKLKKVKECWFLDVGGKLKQLNVLKNAQDVQMQDGIIFADDHLFQLAEDGDDEITLIEIEDIGIKDKRSESENTATIFMGENGASCAGLNDNNRESEVHVEKACKEDITQETTDRTLENSDVDERRSDLEQDDYDLGSEEYVSKKGKFKGFFKRLKQIVKKKPATKQTEEPLYEDTSDISKEPVPGNREVCEGNEQEDYDYTLLEPEKDDSDNDEAVDLCCKLDISCPTTRPSVQFRELEVSRESVKLLQKLGSGCFGEVFAGKWRKTVDVAVKTLEQGQMTADDFLAEAKIMHHLRHAKLVQLMAVCTKTEPIWIITELMINGNLLDYLRKDEGLTLNFSALAYMAGQIAEGMAYLETENCVHRDLRAANILVGDHNEVKVAGFGHARLIQGDFYEAHENEECPIKWTSPETAFDRKCSIKSDVWSYGVLLYELITFGRVPYPGMNGHEVINRVDKGFRMQKPTGGPVPCPDPYYDIMLKCWNRVADSRPTFAYLQDFFNYTTW